MIQDGSEHIQIVSPRPCGATGRRIVRDHTWLITDDTQDVVTLRCVTDSD